MNLPFLLMDKCLLAKSVLPNVLLDFILNFIVMSSTTTNIFIVNKICNFFPNKIVNVILR